MPQLHVLSHRLQKPQTAYFTQPGKTSLQAPKGDEEIE